MKRKLLSTLSLSAACLAAASVLTTPPLASAATPQITVDLSGNTGNVLHGANGSLYGLSDVGVPGDSVLEPLGITTIAQKAPDGLQHPNGDALQVSDSFFRNGGGKIFVYMQDIYANWPYENNGIADYQTKIKTMVPKITANANKANFVYVPFNEPDGNWYTGLGSSDSSTYASALSSFEADWLSTFQLIRSLDSGAKIAGPNETHYSAKFIADFMPWAKANNVLPDYMTWHELSSSSTATWASTYATYRAVETSNGISPRPINIDEYGDRRDLSVPGQLIQWISAFENSKVYADLAYWDIAGNVDDTSVETSKGNGAWWLYQWYNSMSGHTVPITVPSPNTTDTLQATGALDTTKQQAQILLGGSSGSANVVVNNVGTLSSSVTASVYATNWSGYDGSAAAPRLISQQNLTASNGTVTVPVTNMNAMSAYRVVLTPQTTTAVSSLASLPYTASYEAENAAITDATVYTQGTVSNANGYATSGTKDVGSINQSDSAVTFTVTVPTTGQYRVDTFYGNQTGTVSQQYVSVDGGTAQLVNYPGTLNWTYRAVQATTYQLSAGTHTLKYSVSNGTSSAIGEATLDKIDVTAVDSPTVNYPVNLGYVNANGTKVVPVYAAADGYYPVTAVGSSGNLTVNGRVVTSSASATVFLSSGINRLSATNAAAFTVGSAVSTAGVTLYQAENATLAGTAVITSSSWANGGKYVGYIGDGSANTVSFNNVTAATAGKYVLAVQYANNERSGTGNYNTNVVSRLANVTVNGTVIPVYFRNTYSYDDYWTLNIPVTLNAGTNSISFSNPSTYAPNLDYIQVAAAAK